MFKSSVLIIPMTREHHVKKKGYLRFRTLIHFAISLMEMDCDDILATFGEYDCQDFRDIHLRMEYLILNRHFSTTRDILMLVTVNVIPDLQSLSQCVFLIMFVQLQGFTFRGFSCLGLDGLRWTVWGLGFVGA